MNENQIINLVLLLGAALLIGRPFIMRWFPGGGGRVVRIAPAELADRLKVREPLLLVDVRTPPELQDGVVAGTLAIPLDRLSGELAAVKDKLAERPETGVIVICRSGARASRAAGMLSRAGIAKVAVLDGGMLAWVAAGLPVERR